jgi:uncharacterized protein
MLIRLDRVRDEPFRWQEAVSLDPATLGVPEVVALSEIDWRGEIAHVVPDFHLRARYDYQQTLHCSRCVQSFVQPVQGEVDLLVMVGGSAAAGGERQLHERDLGVFEVPDERLDTEPILVEQVLLNVPMSPVCRPDCQGLCPQCGADRNLGPCGCRDQPTDPRWAALAELRSRLPDRKT